MPYRHNESMTGIEVLIVGGGMITHDQLLPSILHMQRRGLVGDVAVCASRPETVKRLAAAESLKLAFPGQTFRRFPEGGPPRPELFREVIGRMPPGQLVIVALPDQLHFDVIMTALRHDQHVCVVKPMVLEYREAQEIEREARARGLLVAVEYHKRWDYRNLIARRRYREGSFGEFRLGTACLLEKWSYRQSNFQNWMTTENSDAFSYVGCHYVDLVHFITGLLPVRVSVFGIRDHFPNGNEGFLWTDARVIWNNGACLSVQNALAFPDAAPGSNAQGLTLYCQSASDGTLLSHSDQYRGLKYSFAESPEPGGAAYREPNPDYFEYVDLGGPGLVPVGYGYRSVEHIVSSAIRIAAEPDLQARQRILRETDEVGIIATPANSAYNELIIEAGRRSILNGGSNEHVELPAERHAHEK
jgi:D-galacturonate reductase